jgi:hypothetical protein
VKIMYFEDQVQNVSAKNVKILFTRAKLQKKNIIILKFLKFVPP